MISYAWWVVLCFLNKLNIYQTLIRTIIKHLENIENRNSYIVSLINAYINRAIYTIKYCKEIKKTFCSNDIKTNL